MVSHSIRLCLYLLRKRISVCFGSLPPPAFSLVCASCSHRVHGLRPNLFGGDGSVSSGSPPHPVTSLMCHLRFAHDTRVCRYPYHSEGSISIGSCPNDASSPPARIFVLAYPLPSTVWVGGGMHGLDFPGPWGDGFPLGFPKETLGKPLGCQPWQLSNSGARQPLPPRVPPAIRTGGAHLRFPE